MEAFERLKRIGLFTDLSDDDLARICIDVTEVRLEPGETLFREHDPGDCAYVIVEGGLEVLKATEGREALVALRGPGAVIGEMALLQEEPRMASVRAGEEPTELLSISKATLDRLLDSSPSAARAMFRALIHRLRETDELLRHRDRMAQLGTLTAGIAHELNNPAAAVSRAAQRLGEELRAYAALVAEVPSVDTGLARARALTLVSGRRPTAVSAPLAQADAETLVEDWLTSRGVEDAWRLAPELVAGGIDVRDLEQLGDDLGGTVLGDAARFLAASNSIQRLVTEVADGAGRLSGIVRALKGYSFLDRSPVQDVDVVEGIEDTLVLLGHKLRGVHIVREFAPDLPRITALGSELNQVWTNLIDNACDALADVPDDRTPTLTLRAHHAGSDVVVEVEDNGPGIAPDARDRIFDAFYTTKPPGRGTGLGLQISYRIVALEHRGDLSVDSEPGRTTFRAVLPTNLRTSDHAGGTTGIEDEESTMEDAPCEHLATVENDPKPEGGCEPCIALGDTWVHLRFCVTCRKVGCCDDSKNRHARRHSEETGHPVIRTKEPDENWAWCIPDDVGIRLPPLG